MLPPSHLQYPSKMEDLSSFIVMLYRLGDLRCDAIEILLNGLGELRDTLYSGELDCSTGASDALLGCLLKLLRQEELEFLIQTPAQRPYEDIQYEDLASRIKKMASPSFYTKLFGKNYSLKRHIQPIVQKAREFIDEKVDRPLLEDHSQR